MSRRTLLVGSVLAAALLAGCSGTPNNGNASAENTTPASTSASSTTSSTSTSSTSSGTTEESTSEDSTTEETTEESTEDETTGSVEPASLDEQSKAWFGTFCTGLSGAFTGMMGALGGAMNTEAAAADPKGTQTTLVTAYQQVATSFTDTAASLDGLPAPTVDNGEQIAEDMRGALAALGEGFGTATENFAAAEVTDQASLDAAMDAFTAETEQYTQELETQFGDLENAFSPEVSAAVEGLPECQMMGS
jgi:hypothetical protein